MCRPCAEHFTCSALCDPPSDPNASDCQAAVPHAKHAGLPVSRESELLLIFKACDFHHIYLWYSLQYCIRNSTQRRWPEKEIKGIQLEMKK